MSDKAYTILLTSNSSTKIKSYTVSKAWLTAGLFVAGLVVVLLMSFVFDYFSVLTKYTGSKNLQSENVILKQKFKLVESKLVSLENTLNRVQGFSDKIKKLNTDTNFRVASVEKSEKKIVAMGPLQASVSPISKLFDTLSFLKKAPLQRLAEKEFSQSKIDQIEIKINELGSDSELKEKSMLSLWEGLSYKKNILDSTPNIRPVKSGWYTSKFGVRTDPFTGVSTMHSGLDIAASPGTPVYAPASGLVSYVGYEDGYGNLVTIDHGYGVKTRYAHNSEIFVKYGQKVSRGSKIAAVGSTGRSSGYHLHYEVRVNGVAVDPKAYIIE